MGKAKSVMRLFIFLAIAIAGIMLMMSALEDIDKANKELEIAKQEQKQAQEKVKLAQKEYNDIISSNFTVPVFAQTQNYNDQQLIEIVNNENARYEKVHDSFMGLLFACGRETLVVFNYKEECSKALSDIQEGGLTDRAFDDLEIRYSSLFQKLGLDQPEHVTMACANEVKVLQDYANLKACAHFMQEYNNLMQKTVDNYKDLKEKMCLSKTTTSICD